MTGYLLDTNALLWVGIDDSQLKRGVRDILFDAPLFVSAISGVEIAVKSSIGKLDLPPPFRTDFGAALDALVRRAAIDVIPVDLALADRLRGLPLHHRDPFDRIIIAQALASGLAVATRDRAFHLYDGLEVLEV